MVLDDSTEEVHQAISYNNVSETDMRQKRGALFWRPMMMRPEMSTTDIINLIFTNLYTAQSEEPLRRFSYLGIAGVGETIEENMRGADRCCGLLFLSQGHSYHTYHMNKKQQIKKCQQQQMVKCFDTVTGTEFIFMDLAESLLFLHFPTRCY